MALPWESVITRPREKKPRDASVRGNGTEYTWVASVDRNNTWVRV